MAPRKLSDSDKQIILDLYRTTDETSSTIASRYGVSNSTISRILKQNLTDEEYEGLIQQKRSASRGQADADLDLEGNAGVGGEDESETPTLDFLPSEVSGNSLSIEPNPAEIVTSRRQRKRSTVAKTLSDETPIIQSELQLAFSEPASQELETSDGGYAAEASPIQEILEEEIVEPGEEFEEGLEDDELTEDELDDDDLDDDDLDEDGDDYPLTANGSLADIAVVHVQRGEQLRILPLSEALIPKTFYLVVDRSSELITRPLKDFADLGQIPDEEIQEKTLPIFDNHRVAKRFLRRMQRVVKVPDGKVLQKVSPYLQAKGITRLLIDGRVYSI